jgi:putative phage-type endonuclease
MPGATVLPVRQRTDEWLEARMNGIGASEAAAAVGLSQWESRLGLWAHKLGLVPAREPTMPMRLGQELEPFIARLYTEQTGVKVRRANNLRQHPQHAFMLASLDRRAGRKPIELKWSERGMGYGEPGTDEVPDEVLCQVLHQLAVVDEPEGEVALLRPNRPEVAIYTIRREQAAEDWLIGEEAVLWDAVQSRTEPPTDGSEATREALAAIYPRDNGEAVTADDDGRQAMAALRHAREQLDAWEAIRATREAEIKAAIGDATRIVAPGLGEITWKTTKDSETTDWKSIAAELRDLVDGLPDLDGSLERAMSDAFGTTSLEDVFALHTVTKPGSRRFLPKWQEE